MKDNLESGAISNRKIVIELRYLPIASILDKKGTIADAVASAKIFRPGNFWEISNNTVRFQNNSDRAQSSTTASVEYNRLSFICTKIDSIESYFNTFVKFYDIVKTIIPSWTVTRIGCRIIGSYNASSNDFGVLLDGIKNLFPSNFFIEPYNPQNVQFRSDYANGMYQIGLLKENDEFFQREFPVSTCKPKVGLMIDTDNYLLKMTEESIESIENIKKIFVASLAVEKSLYENLRLI